MGRSAAILTIGLLLPCLPASAQHGRDLSVEPTTGGRRVALVIGNANYPGHKLANPVHDAEDFGAALTKAGFTVSVAKDVSRQAMRDLVSKFVGSLHDGDVALFYFSGHGLEVDGENLLVPADFPQSVPGSPVDTKNAAFAFDDVQRALEQSRARLNILVMDACRTNPYRDHTRAWDQGGPAPVEAGLGSYVAFAASPGQTADDNSGERNGLFTKFLLQALQQEPPPLSQVFRQVRDSVYEASGKRQRPYLVDQVTGDFSFSSSGKPAVAPARQETAAPPENPMQEGLVLYRQGRCDEALKLFDRAIREHPQDAFAQNAVGVAYVCLKKYSLAIPRFDTAVHLRPSFAEAYLNRGAAYSAVGQYDLAVENFDWAIEQEPWNSLFFTRRGEANFSVRKYEEAAADFNRAIELDPAGAAAFHGRGRVLERQGHYQEAAADFAAALERNSTLTAAKQDLERVSKRLPGH